MNSNEEAKHEKSNFCSKVFISDRSGTDDPGLPTLILGSMLGLLLHYRLDPEIAIEPAQDLLINTIHSFQK